MDQEEMTDDEDELDNLPIATDKEYRIIKGEFCVCPETGAVKRLTEVWKSIERCELYACHKGGLISVMSCPRFLYDKKNPRPECKIKAEDPQSNEFPECCEYIKCERQPDDVSPKNYLRKELADAVFP